MSELGAWVQGKRRTPVFGLVVSSLLVSDAGALRPLRQGLRPPPGGNGVRLAPEPAAQAEPVGAGR